MPTLGSFWHKLTSSRANRDVFRAPPGAVSPVIRAPRAPSIVLVDWLSEELGRKVTLRGPDPTGDPLNQNYIFLIEGETKRFILSDVAWWRWVKDANEDFDIVARRLASAIKKNLTVTSGSSKCSSLPS